VGIPVSEVHVQWTEMPGSKIRFTSILHMAWELLTLKVAYQWLRAWPVAAEAQLARKAQ
jgi:dolichyl-phosphate beta-glucosyltransferase